LPSVRHEVQLARANGIGGLAVKRKFQAKNSSRAGEYPPNSGRCKPTPQQRIEAGQKHSDEGDARGDSNSKILEMLTEMMTQEHRDGKVCLRDIGIRSDGFIITFWTDESMRITELLVGNNGRFYESAAPLQFDPKHGKSVYILETITVNLFLEGNPRWVGSVTVFVRTTARWYHKILENMRIDDKNEHVTRARWVDLDGEPGLRTAYRLDSCYFTVKIDSNTRNVEQTKFHLSEKRLRRSNRVSCAIHNVRTSSMTFVILCS
jgi:hypothetical protein